MFLPSQQLKTTNNKGFTLVELMVVVSIVAILSVVGVTVYSGIQTRARDAARRADIDAIANALEVNKVSGGVYTQLANAQFAAGTIPLKDPSGNVYCGNVTPSTIASNNITAQPTATDCVPATNGAGSPPATIGYKAISDTVPVPAAGTTSWKICTWLETTSAAYCKQSTQ